MNILMISPFDLVTSRLWGPTIRLHSLAKELKGMGHKVLLAGPPPFAMVMPPTLDGIDLYYFRRALHRYNYPDDGRQQERKKINRRSRIPWVLLSRCIEIWKLASKFRADVLYVNRAFPDTAYPAFFVHTLKNIPIVCDWDDLEGIHGFSTAFRQPIRTQLFETFNEVFFPFWADATVVASSYLREFAENLRVQSDKLFLAPTVSDSVLFHPSVDGKSIRTRFGLTDKKVLLYAGNLCKGNGVKVENILYTLKFLVEKDPSFSLLVVGDGDLIKNNGKKGILIELAESLRITEHVIFTGGIPYRDMPKYVAAADACLALFPVNLITMSKSPLKVYEYMAAGKPVFARDVGELSRCIIDDETGILVYTDRPEEYAGRILDVFSKTDHIKKIGDNARRIIEDQFNWKSSAGIVLKACEKARDDRCR
jgi:glycosyltransferase involved in cell wall biosynthesis